MCEWPTHVVFLFLLFFLAARSSSFSILTFIPIVSSPPSRPWEDRGAKLRAGGRREAPTTAAAATSHKRRSLIISRTSCFGVRDQLLNLYDGAANIKRVKINNTCYSFALERKTPGLFQALYTFSLSFPPPPSSRNFEDEPPEKGESE